MRVFFLLLLLIFLLASPLVAESSDALTLNLIADPPERVGLRSKNRDRVRFKLETNARKRNRFLNAIEWIRLRVIDTEKGEMISEETFTGKDEFENHTFTPLKTGIFWLKFRAKMKSGYVYDYTKRITAINGPTVPAHCNNRPGCTFNVDMAYPDNLYKAIDIAFVIDRSGSMVEEIQSTRSAAVDIFNELRMITGGDIDNVKASVATFTRYDQLPGDIDIYGSNRYSLQVSPTTDPSNLTNMQISTGGGGEFQFYALYKTAMNQSLWRHDAVKFLVLMTDEHDNVYCGEDKAASCDYQREVQWQGHDTSLSVEDILKELADKNFSTTVLYNQVDGEAKYGTIMREVMKNKFAGTYRIPTNQNSSTQVTESIYSSIDALIKGSSIHINIAGDDLNLISSITPLEPSACIDSRNKDSFQYQCLRNIKKPLRYRITFSEIPINLNKYTFMILMRSDKGSLVAAKLIEATIMPVKDKTKAQ